MLKMLFHWSLYVAILTTKSFNSFYIRAPNIPIGWKRIDTFTLSANADSDPIEGASNVVVVSDTPTSKIFLPKPLLSLPPIEQWRWYRERGLVESKLKTAIASSEADINKYFEDFEPYLAIEKADVLHKNELFFQALSKGDSTLLKSLWLESNNTLCILASMPTVVTGYRNIINWITYTSTKQDTPKAVYATKNITLNFNGNFAVVSSYVEPTNLTNVGILSRKKGKISTIHPMYSTNIFVKPIYTDTYMLLAHISSQRVEEGSKAQRALKRTYVDPSRSTSSRSKGFGGMLGGMGIQGMNVIPLQRFMQAQRRPPQKRKDEDDESDGSDGASGDQSIKEGDADKSSSGPKNAVRSAIAQALSKLGIPMNSGGTSATNGVMVISSNDGTKSVRNFGSDENIADSIEKAIKDTIGSAKVSSKTVTFDIDKNGKITSSGELGGSNIVNSRTYGDDDDLTMSSTKKLSSDSEKLRKNYPSSKSKKKAFSFTNSKRNTEDDDDDEDDSDYDDEDSEQTARELASSTLRCIKWLYTQGRLTLEEKQLLTNDVISSNSLDEFAKVETAFALIIGPGKPNELFSSRPDSDIDDDDDEDDDENDEEDEEDEENVTFLTSLSTIDMATINEEDMDEFEQICHEIARELV